MTTPRRADVSIATTIRRRPLGSGPRSQGESGSGRAVARRGGTGGELTAGAIAGRVAAATVGFALLHSVLASRRAKAAAARMFGTRRRNGLYRACFNTQAVVTSTALAYYIRRLPDRELYVVRHPIAAVMRAGQVAGVLLLADAVRRVGVLPIAGITSIASLTRGDVAVLAEPEGQGPSLGLGGTLKVRGAFVRSRHPLNMAAVPILWLNPRMTRNLAVFSAVATFYFWSGSWHEERRLTAAYGEPYREYANSGVPFFFGTRTLRPERCDDVTDIAARGTL